MSNIEHKRNNFRLFTELLRKYSDSNSRLAELRVSDTLIKNQYEEETEDFWI